MNTSGLSLFVSLVAERRSTSTRKKWSLHQFSHIDMVVWPSMVKMTFTLDDTTVAALRRIAHRLQKPQSYVLREAITHYEPHAGHLSKAERKRRVELFDQVIAAIAKKPASAADRELKRLRQSRRKGRRR